MDKNKELTLKIKLSQKWLIIKALMELTSDESAEKILKEFPSVDLEAMEEDINDLVTRIQEAK